MNPWKLPKEAVICGTRYRIHTDFREILEILGYLDDPDMTEYVRWRVALALFFDGEMPPEHYGEAMGYLAEFISYDTGEARSAHKLLDWQQDAGVIIADVNKVAGKEIRDVEYIHWWTFLSWFKAIGEGQLCTLVSIRDKLKKGKKLESWEREYYQANKTRVDLKPRYSSEELAEQQRLKTLLGD